MNLANHGVLVLGMHRSGTSAVAACLERLGVSMGSSLATADQWNPNGYFEERRIVAFNDTLLSMAGTRWDAPLPPAPAAGWAAQQADAATLLHELYAEAGVWGFKDPRMCLLAGFWRPVFTTLQVQPRLLLVLRHPEEVAASLARRDGMSQRRAGWLWFIHLLGALDYLASASDCRVIDFADLLSEPAQQLAEMTDWLGLPPHNETFAEVAAELIAPHLAQRCDTKASELHPLVLRAYHYWLHTACHATFSDQWLQATEWLAIREQFEREIQPDLHAVQQFFTGDRQAAVSDARLTQLSHALANSERLALARLDQLAGLDEQLKRTTSALAVTENLALQRLSEAQALDQQLRITSEAFSRAEQLALERLAELQNTRGKK